VPWLHRGLDHETGAVRGVAVGRIDTLVGATPWRATASRSTAASAAREGTKSAGEAKLRRDIEKAMRRSGRRSTSLAHGSRIG
jgi:hypothetical protein